MGVVGGAAKAATVVDDRSKSHAHDAKCIPKKIMTLSFLRHRLVCEKDIEGIRRTSARLPRQSKIRPDSYQTIVKHKSSIRHQALFKVIAY